MRSLARTALGIALSAGLLLLLVREVKFGEVLEALGHVPRC